MMALLECLVANCGGKNPFNYNNINNNENKVDIFHFLYSYRYGLFNVLSNVVLLKSSKFQELTDIQQFNHDLPDIIMKK